MPGGHRYRTDYRAAESLRPRCEPHRPARIVLAVEMKDSILERRSGRPESLDLGLVRKRPPMPARPPRGQWRRPTIAPRTRASPHCMIRHSFCGHGSGGGDSVQSEFQSQVQHTSLCFRRSCRFMIACGISFGIGARMGRNGTSVLPQRVALPLRSASRPVQVESGGPHPLVYRQSIGSTRLTRTSRGRRGTNPFGLANISRTGDDSMRSGFSESSVTLYWR